MFANVFLKTIYEKRWFIFGWGLGAIGLLALTAAFFPTFRDSGLDKVMGSIPPALKNMMGELAEYTTFPGYVASAVFGLRAQMLFVPLAIILGISLGISEEANGRIYQLLAQPISRRSVLIQKFFAGLTISALVVAVSVVAVGAVAVLVNEPIPYELLGKIALMTTLFTWAVFSVTFGLGKAFGRKSIALFVPLVWVMFSVLSDAFSAQVDWLKNADYASLFRYYRTSALVHNPLDWTHIAVLIGIAIIPVLCALILFARRDLREASE
mgnify:CR=1 FL=1